MVSAVGARILGIDPGSRATGYAVVELVGQTARSLEHGVIRVPVTEALPLRLARLHAALLEIVRIHRPTEVAIEEVFTARNARAALVLGHARGVLLLAASTAECEIHEYAARSVKKAIVGYGQADKEQVAQMVARLLNLQHVPAQDAADALAIALCHAHTRQFRRSVERGEARQRAAE